MNLTDWDNGLIKAIINRGETLSTKYKFTLFAEGAEVERFWRGKTKEVEVKV